jgi:hypothetical protein
MTTAVAACFVVLMDKCIFFILLQENLVAASPDRERIYFFLSYLTVISLHDIPYLQPVPSAFRKASLAAKRPAYISASFFLERQYVISFGVKALEIISYLSLWRVFSILSTSIMSTPVPKINSRHLPELRVSNNVTVRNEMNYCIKNDFRNRITRFFSRFRFYS